MIRDNGPWLTMIIVDDVPCYPQLSADAGDIEDRRKAAEEQDMSLVVLPLDRVLLVNDILNALAHLIGACALERIVDNLEAISFAQKVCNERESGSLDVLLNKIVEGVKV